MSTTLATFHEPMLALHVGVSLKSEFVSLTALTSQSAMLPYVVVAVVGFGFITHAVSAVLMVLPVMSVTACAAGVQTSCAMLSSVKSGTGIENACAPGVMAQLQMRTAPMSRRRFTLRSNAGRRGHHRRGRPWKDPASGLQGSDDCAPERLRVGVLV